MVEHAAEQKQIPRTGKMIVAGLQSQIAAPQYNPANQAVDPTGLDALDAGQSLLVGMEIQQLTGVFK